MTRATLLATTAAILIPLAGAFAQETDSGVTQDTRNSGSGAVSAETGSDTQNGETMGDSVSDTADNAMDEAGDAAAQVGETAEDAGDAAASTAENAMEETGEAVEDTADAMTPEADATADAEAGMTGGMTVGELTGMSVIDAAGEEVGEIDMVVSGADGAAAVIGVGGFLGIGEHDVAIPVADLKMSGEGQLKLSGHTREDLGRLPEFEQDSAEALEDEQPVPDLG